MLVQSSRFHVESVSSSEPFHDLVEVDRHATSPTISPARTVRKLDTRTDWAGASQLVTVTVATKTSTRATVAYWERGTDGKFRTIRSTSQGWVGELGIGQGQWGVPRIPEGIYRLTETFGILPDPGTRMPYFQVDSYDWWDGDPGSPTYNTHVREPWVPGAGSERLINFGAAYHYAAAFDYNTERDPAKGSAFFFHVSTNEPTGGCISAPAADVAAILRAADPAKSPVIIVAEGPSGTALADRTRKP